MVINIPQVQEAFNKACRQPMAKGEEGRLIAEMRKSALAVFSPEIVCCRHLTTTDYPNKFLAIKLQEEWVTFDKTVLGFIQGWEAATQEPLYYFYLGDPCFGDLYFFRNDPTLSLFPKKLLL